MDIDGGDVSLTFFTIIKTDFDIRKCDIKMILKMTVL